MRNNDPNGFIFGMNKRLQNAGMAEIPTPGRTGALIASILALPNLRLCVPFTSVNESGNAYDLSGQGRALTNNNTAGFGFENLTPYVILDGVNQYFSRADEAGLDITGNLTVGGWFRFTSVVAATKGLITKDDLVSARSYRLTRFGTGYAHFSVDRLGDNTSTSAVSSTTSIDANTWYFIAGRFQPSTKVVVTVNGTHTENTTAIVASTFNSATAFEIGRIGLSNANCAAVNAFGVFVCAAIVSNAMLENLYSQGLAVF